MSDLGTGYYLLTLWANASGANAATVRSNFKNTYGESVIENLGKGSHDLFFGQVSEEMEREISNGASKESPTLQDITSAVSRAAGYTPSVFSTLLESYLDVGRAAPEVVKGVAEWSGSIVKYAAIAAVAVAVIYVVMNGEKSPRSWAMLHPKDKAILFIAGLALILILTFGDTADQAIEAYMKDPKFERWDSLLREKAAKYGVPFRYLKAIIMVESSNGQNKRVLRGLSNPTDIEGSKSTDGLSWGLAQVTLKTAKALAGRVVYAEELNNPDFNVELAAKLVRELGDKYKWNEEKIFRDYNGGPKMGPLTLAYWVKIQAALKVVDAYEAG